MPYWLYTAMSLTIGLGALAGVWRAAKIDRRFAPFLWFLWAGAANEIASYFLLRSGYSNLALYNVYAGVEALLLSYQFKLWGLFRKKIAYPLVQGLFLFLWTAETLWHGLFAIHSLFLILSSFALVVFSILILTEVIYFDPGRLLRQPQFLICFGCIVFFSFSILVECFWVFGLGRSLSFRIHVYTLLYLVNAITNLLFAYSVLWIPMRPRYILQW